VDENRSRRLHFIIHKPVVERSAAGGVTPTPTNHPNSRLIRGHFIQRRRNRIFLLGLSFIPLGYIISASVSLDDRSNL
jgi:hypothetical protein